MKYMKKLYDIQGASKKRGPFGFAVTQKKHFSSKSPLQLFLKIASNFKSKLVPYEDKKTVISSFGESSSSFRPGVKTLFHKVSFFLRHTVQHVVDHRCWRGEPLSCFQTH